VMEIFFISVGASSLIVSLALFYKILIETNLKKSTATKSTNREINSSPPQDELELSKRLEEFRNQKFARPIVINKRGGV
jgi:hypothetical protein